MKRLKKARRLRLLAAWLAVAALAPAAALAAGHEIHGSNDFSITYNDVQGAGGSQSSLTEGTRYLEILNLFGNGRAGDFDYNWTVGTKATDDRRNDQKTFSLTNLQGRLTNKIHTITLGDTFEAFSQYSLNTAVKGGSYKFTPEQSHLPQVSLLYGIAYSRWDNFWGVDAVERQVAGGKIRQNIGPDFWIGLSGVQTDDHVRVLGGELTNHQTWTVDWEYRPIPGLTIQGESSWLNGDRSPSDGAPFDAYHGHAHKVVAIGDGGPSRVTLEYERVSPEFRTTIGSATPDREKVKAKWRYKYSKDLSITSAMLWYHDNLDGQKAYGTDHYKPEIAVSLKKPFARQYAVADISYKLDRAYSPVMRSLDHYITMGYRDRFGVLDSDSTFGIIVYDQNGAAKRKDVEFTYNTSLSSRHTLGRFVLKPSIYLGGWTHNDEVAENTDQIVEYSVGLGVDVPDLKITSTIRVGENRLLKEAGTDTAKTFAGANVFWRPEMLAKAQGMLYAKASVNDFRYDPNLAAGSRNFRETSVTAGISIQF